MPLRVARSRRSGTWSRPGPLDFLDDPAQPPRGMSAKSGSRTPCLTRTLAPARSEGDRFALRAGHGSLLGGQPARSPGMYGINPSATPPLKLPLQMPGVHDEAVDLDHPGHRVVAHPAGQRPMRVGGADLQQGTDRLRLSLASALGDPNALSMAVSFMCGFRRLSSR